MTRLFLFQFDMTTIYHNPRCSKSRNTLSLLNEQGVNPDIVLYLDNPPTVATLKSLVDKLGVSIFDIVRKGESVYAELGLKQREVDENEMMQIISENPKLLERPIVVNGDKAAVGRPPENVLNIL